MAVDSDKIDKKGTRITGYQTWTGDGRRPMVSMVLRFLYCHILELVGGKGLIQTGECGKRCSAETEYLYLGFGRSVRVFGVPFVWGWLPYRFCVATFFETHTLRLLFHHPL